MRFLVLAVGVLVVAGCATTSGNGFDPSLVGTFKPGVTTVAEAETRLGQPFQATKQPDGTEILQYVTTQKVVADSGMPTTGTSIPKRNETKISTMLSFDQSGHFVHAWSSSKEISKNWPSDLAAPLQGGDMKYSPGH